MRTYGGAGPPHGEAAARYEHPAGYDPLRAHRNGAVAVQVRALTADPPRMRDAVFLGLVLATALPAAAAPAPERPGAALPPCG